MCNGWFGVNNMVSCLSGLGRGLQNHIHWFDSSTHLKQTFRNPDINCARFYGLSIRQSTGEMVLRRMFVF